jgi:hypothetical protein
MICPYTDKTIILVNIIFGGLNVFMPKTFKFSSNYEKYMHTNFSTSLVFLTMFSLERVVNTKLMWWFLKCTLIKNGAFDLLIEPSHLF